MTIKKIYVAKDGKEFLEEEACYRHEAELRAKEYEDIALLFDKDGHILPLTEEGFENAYFIQCKTHEAAVYVYDEFSDNHFTPWCDGNVIDAGCWFYDGEHWCDVNELYRVAEIAKKITG